MAEVEIGTEPGVRHCVRTLFLAKAEVTTEPTPGGGAGLGRSIGTRGSSGCGTSPLRASLMTSGCLWPRPTREGLLKATVALPQSEIDAIMQVGLLQILLAETVVLLWNK